MKKTKIAIVSSGSALESILAAIDFDSITVCAFWGFWNDMTESSRKLFEPIFQPLDMLSVNCKKYDAEYFLVNIHQNIDTAIINKLINKGVPKENIIGMWPFGSIPQFTYMYFLQWQYLLNSSQGMPPPPIYCNWQFIF